MFEAFYKDNFEHKVCEKTTGMCGVGGLAFMVYMDEHVKTCKQCKEAMDEFGKKAEKVFEGKYIVHEWVEDTLKKDGE
jgi:hypothetical protein